MSQKNYKLKKWAKKKSEKIFLFKNEKMVFWEIFMATI
jgi:hypothetical protein